MSWWKWLLAPIALALGGLVFLPVAAQAGVTANITLFATPLWGGGITGFTITYVTETKLKLDWGLGTGTDRVMIRAKYGSYPADIVATSEIPSDGYQVYYGTGITTNDTSMDFDANPGPIYYRAWAQLADNSWVLSSSAGSEESMIMTLLAFLTFAGIVSFIGARSSFWLLKFLAGLAWWAGAMYWINNRPSTIAQGDPEDIAVIGLLFFVGLAFMLMPYWYTKEDGAGGRFRLPWMQTDDQEEEDARARYSPSRSERNAAYEARVQGALKGQIKRR